MTWECSAEAERLVLIPGQLHIHLGQGAVLLLLLLLSLRQGQQSEINLRSTGTYLSSLAQLTDKKTSQNRV